MNIIDLKKVANIQQSKRLSKRYDTLEKLILELNQKEIPPEIINAINQEIESINSYTELSKSLSKQLRIGTMKILKLIEKKLNLVPKNLYRSRWMAIGMSMGVVLGVAFGASMDRSGFLAIGIGVGMVLGMAIGAGMDKKAKKEGRQLDFEVKY